MIYCWCSWPNKHAVNIAVMSCRCSRQCAAAVCEVGIRKENPLQKNTWQTAWMEEIWRWLCWSRHDYFPAVWPNCLPWRKCKISAFVTWSCFNNVIQFTISVTSAFLWRYEPVRHTGKSDDWLTIFARIIRLTVQKFPLFWVIFCIIIFSLNYGTF